MIVFTVSKQKAIQNSWKSEIFPEILWKKSEKRNSFFGIFFQNNIQYKDSSADLGVNSKIVELDPQSRMSEPKLYFEYSS